MYGFTLAEFLATLASADVRLLLDVRQRRGVRGPDVVARTLDEGYTIGGPANEISREVVKRAPGGFYRGRTLEGVEVETAVRAVPEGVAQLVTSPEGNSALGLVPGAGLTSQCRALAGR